MRTVRLFAICVILQTGAWAQQAAPGWLEITGDVPHSRTYQEQDWKQLKHASLSATNAHEKKTAIYSGVWLRDLLKEAGVPSGENLRGKALATSIVVIANDAIRLHFRLPSWTKA